MKFSSEYADNADDLLRLKTQAYFPVIEKRKRLQIVRNFTNMMNMLTPEQAEELSETTEITNHGLSYRAMVQNQSQFQSMVNGTNALCEIIVNTGDAESDFDVGQKMSQSINIGAIHHKRKFGRFWDKCAGEFVIAGGVPATQCEKYGWLPEVQLDMFFPRETSLDPEEITYAFKPRQLTVKDLNELLEATEGEGEYLDVGAIKSLLKKIKENIKNATTTSTPYFNEETKGTRETLGRNVNIPAWEFYEMKYDDEGEQYVSSTLFVDATTCIPKKSKSNAYIISYYDKAFDYACDWLQLLYVDSEISGVKNLDTLKGVAEMQFNSAQDMEELLNLIIEGEKIRARPMFKVADQANVDKLAKWDARKSLYAPEGIEEMVLRGSSNGLQGPLSILSQNASSITQTGSSGNSGQLRVEALNNQQETAALQANKVTDAYDHLDSLLDTCVHRLLSGETKAGTKDYRDMMWVRNNLKAHGIDYKKLAEREFGRFKYIRVRAKRSVGNGDRQQQLETSDWLLENSSQFPPESRPIILHQATVLRTQDPDLADRVVTVPKAIINAQKLTAENEADTIRRRAPLGQILPVSPGDINQDHIPVHMLDMQALLAGNDVRPWDKRDVMEFAGLTEHTMAHINILYENKATNGEAKGYLQDFQNIAQAAQKVVAQVQEKEGSEENKLTPAEEANLQIKIGQLHLEARKLGLKEADYESLFKERESRNLISQRSQLVGEINDHRKLQLDKQKVDQQSEQKPTDGTN